MAAKFFDRPPKAASFADLLPYHDYEPQTQTFLLDDDVSCGQLFRLTLVPCEARSVGFRDTLAERLGQLVGSLPQDPNPWVLQFYPRSHPTLESTRQRIDRYYREASQNHTPWRAQYQQWLDDHLQAMTSPEGRFIDKTVTGQPFRGRTVDVMGTLYQRQRKSGSRVQQAGFDALQDVAEQYQVGLREAGVSVQKVGWPALHEWLLPWFQPATPREALLAESPCAAEVNLPFGYDLAEQLLVDPPIAEPAAHRFRFQDWPSRYLRVKGLSHLPSTAGHLSAELFHEPNYYSFLDRLPARAQWVMNVVLSSQQKVDQRIAFIQARGERAHTGSGEVSFKEARIAEYERTQGNSIFHVSYGLYLTAPSDGELKRQVSYARALLSAYHVPMVEESIPALAMHYYLASLPFGYHPGRERVEKSSRYTYADHIAETLPLYGRATGTEHPGWLLWNRGGEPLTIDFYRDKVANSHFVLTGPTGTGKSALLTGLMMALAAAHRPRLVIVELGNSFGALAALFAEGGLSVHSARMGETDVSIPAFAGALECLALASEAVDEEVSDADFLSGERDRLRLTELEIIAELMVTEGDNEARLTRPDKMLLRSAILEAARQVQARGETTVRVSDVQAAVALEARNTEHPETRRARADAMAASLALFCTPGTISDRLFNRAGARTWPDDADVIHFDIGYLKHQPELLVISVITLLQATMAQAETSQYENRPTYFIVDEAQEFFWCSLLNSIFVKISKEMRKKGVWLGLATPSLENFAGAAERIIGMCEYKMVLSPPDDELQLLKRFYSLTDEQVTLAQSCRKQEGDYVEGVLFTPNEQLLFRHIPPPEVLAAAYTDQDQKAARRDRMDAEGLTLTEAVRAEADLIKQKPATPHSPRPQETAR